MVNGLQPYFYKVKNNGDEDDETVDTAVVSAREASAAVGDVTRDFYTTLGKRRRTTEA